MTNDPGGFTTVGQPIADLRTAEPSRKAPSGRPVCRFATLRQQFAVGPGRDPRVVAAIGVYAALSLVAVVAQTVRGWPYFVDHPVVGGNGPHAVERVAHPRLPSNTGPGLVNGGPDLASSAPEALPSERPTSAGDPLVGQAVNHLLRGREAEAAGVYAALAGRYPSEPVYAATVKVLRRRLNPACQQGIEIDCGKALP
ncbi:MAG TPA: hypothetical protein VJV79_12605 [Polyangiaceae bacterium]|nr:hypothetical protein [Polyangiaceae bacterium]